MPTYSFRTRVEIQCHEDVLLNGQDVFASGAGSKRKKGFYMNIFGFFYLGRDKQDCGAYQLVVLLVDQA